MTFRITPTPGRPRQLPPVKRILAMLEAGWLRVEIARKYGVTPAAVTMEIKRKQGVAGKSSATWEQ